MEFLLYIAKVNIAIVLLYFLYKLVFQHDTMFAVKRAVLLFSLLFALVYPMITIFTTLVSSLNQSEVLHIFDLTALIVVAQPELAVTATTIETIPRFSLMEIIIIAITALYLIGIAFFAIKVITQVISVLQIILSARKENINGVDVLVSNRPISPFSFFGKIIISEKTCAGAELNQILLHEQTHVRQWHSIDVILSELFCAFAWFNPAAWRLKREIRLNLEYLADGEVIASGCDVEHYQLGLVQLSYQKNNTTITNNFNFSPIKKRIIMMQKTKTQKIGLIKNALILPVAFALMFLSTAATPPLPPDVEIVTEVSADLQQFDQIFEIVEMLPPTPQNQDPIFEVVEVRPEFPGGVQAMNEFLNRNIRYPPLAFEQGISGRVMVQFIVERDGSLSDVVAVMGPDPSLNREAVRVVSAMPNWQPARQGGETVRVRFTLPVTFRLANDAPATTTATQTPPPPPPPQNIDLDEIFDIVEQRPQFTGGDAAMVEFLNRNMRYPPAAQEAGVQGRVTVQFVVERDGSITNVVALAGPDPSLMEEAVRVIQAMPRWQPGRQGGQAVRTLSMLPVMFRLSAPE